MKVSVFDRNTENTNEMSIKENVLDVHQDIYLDNNEAVPGNSEEDLQGRRGDDTSQVQRTVTNSDADIEEAFIKTVQNNIDIRVSNGLVLMAVYNESRP